MNEGIPKNEPIQSQADYTLEKHGRWNTSPEIIADVVAQASGGPIIERERIINGESNEVYSVTIEGGQELIVRIYHGEKNRFERENWALDRSREKGVPVPEMLHIRSVKDAGALLQVCVETKLPGVSLQEYRDESGQDKRERVSKMLHALGAELMKVHSVKTDGWGALDKEGKGKYQSVSELIDRDVIERKDDILEALKEKPEDFQLVERAFHILQNEAATFDSEQPCLIHNDLSPEHVLVEHDRISGLIDFESALGGDPLLEFALWDFKHGAKYPLKDIIEGYGKQELFTEDFERRLNFWKIYRSLASLRYCIQEKKQSGIARALDVIRKSTHYFH